MRTSADYLKKLQSMKLNCYMWGKKIETPVDDPQIRANFNALAITYDAAHDPKLKKLMTTKSHITGNTINHYTALYRGPKDMIKRIEINRILCHMAGNCIARCVGIDGLHSIGIMSYETDKAFGTNYYQRYLDYFKYFQDNDLSSAGAVMDVKGDRALRPHEQVDPDLYLRVVEKKKNGVIVRGAKAHTSHAVVCDEIIVLPSRGLTEKDKDYAIAFAIPTDTKGITYVNVANVPGRKSKFTHPVSSKFGFSDSLTIFDDVFIPNERIFMCGEWQFAGRLGALFGHFHRLSHCGCIPARADILTGAASMIAKYNGIADKPHVRSKVVDLITSPEIVYSCGLVSALKAKKTPSGIYMPNATYCNIGKFHESQNIARDIAIVADLSGGLLFTMPSDEDYALPKIGDSIKKYLKGAVNVPVEDRIRMFRLIDDITSFMRPLAEVVGAGSPEAQRMGVLGDYDLESKEEIAKHLAGIKSKFVSVKPAVKY